MPLNLLENILSNAVGYGVGTAMGPPLAPLVQELANEMWTLTPVMPLPADIAARIALKRPAILGAMADEARMTGFNAERFAHMIDAADAPPGLAELLELLRRNVISEAEFKTGLGDVLIPARWHEPLTVLRHVLLSPADLAMMRQQSFISEAEQKARSVEQGVSDADAELLFEISGEPPGPETMVELWRRGKVSEERVRQAVVEGRLKLKYTDDILALKHVPLSAALAAEAVLRERHLPKDPHYYAEAAGIDPTDFDAWVDLMGRPIAAGEALTLARRGQFTFAQFKEAIARSDVRTEYADDLWKLREVLPTPLELRRMLAINAIADDLATEIMVKRGYSAEIAAGIVRASHSEGTAKQRELAVSQILELFEAGFESRDWALGYLKQLGYDDTAADLELTTVEAKRFLAYLHAALARVKASYVNHKIDDQTATADLKLLGIDDNNVGLYMDLWGQEREANVKRLSAAQIGKAYKLNLIDKATAISMWEQDGYPEFDAQVLAALAVNPDATTPSPTSPT